MRCGNGSGIGRRRLGNGGRIAQGDPDHLLERLHQGVVPLGPKAPRLKRPVELEDERGPGQG